MWDGGHGGMMGYGGFGGFGGFFGLLFWILIIVGAVVLIKWLFDKANNKPPLVPSALEILNQRFAAGEITEEEYLRMKKRIEGHE